MKVQTPDFILSMLWPPNNPHEIHDDNECHQSVVKWEKMDHCFIDESVLLLTLNDYFYIYF